MIIGTSIKKEVAYRKDRDHILTYGIGVLRMNQNYSMKIYLLSRKLYKKKVPLLPKLLSILNRVLFSCDLPYTAKLSETTELGHNGLATVIHPKAIIGKNTLVMQHSIIGGNMGKYRYDKGEKVTYPVIGDNVLIGAGAKILGPIVIGDYAQIGAGSIVLNDVADREVVVGSPAKVVANMTLEEAKNKFEKI